MAPITAPNLQAAIAPRTRILDAKSGVWAARQAIQHAREALAVVLRGEGPTVAQRSALGSVDIFLLLRASDLTLVAATLTEIAYDDDGGQAAVDRLYRRQR